MQLPVPLQFPPTLLKIAVQQQVKAAIEVRFGIIGRQLHRPAGSSAGLVEFALFLQDDTEGGVRVGMAGLDTQSLPVAGDSFVEPALSPQNTAEVAVQFSEARARRRACRQQTAASSSFPVASGGSEVAVRPSVVGIQQQRLAQTGDGFVQPALVREEAAEVIMASGSWA